MGQLRIISSFRLLLTAGLQIASCQKWHNTSLPALVSSSSVEGLGEPSKLGWASSNYGPKPQQTNPLRHTQISGSAQSASRQYDTTAKPSRWSYLFKSRHWPGTNGSAFASHSLFASSWTTGGAYHYYECTTSFQYEAYQPASSGSPMKPVHPWYGKPWTNSSKEYVTSTGVMQSDHKPSFAVTRYSASSYWLGGERADRWQSSRAITVWSAARNITKPSQLPFPHITTGIGGPMSTAYSTTAISGNSSGRSWWPSSSVQLVNNSRPAHSSTYATISKSSARFREHSITALSHAFRHSRSFPRYIMTSASSVNGNTTTWTICTFYGSFGGGTGGQGPGWMTEEQTTDIKEPTLTAYTSTLGPGITTLPSAPAPLQEQPPETFGGTSRGRTGFQALTSAESPNLVQPVFLDTTTPAVLFFGTPGPRTALEGKVTSEIVEPVVSPSLLDVLKNALQGLPPDVSENIGPISLVANLLQAAMAMPTPFTRISSDARPPSEGQGQALRIVATTQRPDNGPRVPGLLEALNNVAADSGSVEPEQADTAVPLATFGSATLRQTGTETPVVLLGSSLLSVGQSETIDGIPIEVQSTAVVIGSTTIPLRIDSVIATQAPSETGQPAARYASTASQRVVHRLMLVSLSSLAMLVYL